MKNYSLLLVSTFLFLTAPDVVAQQTDTSSMKKKNTLDSSVANYYNALLAGSQLKKSRTGKAIGYGMLATGMGMVIYSIATERSGSALPIAGCVLMAMSNPVMTNSARAKGRAEAMMMDPEKYATPEQRAALLKSYRSTATGCSITGWVLFLGGLTGFIAAGFYEDGAGLGVATAAMFASLPVWMVSAKNKGRISVISGRYAREGNISISPAQRGIGIALSLGK